MSLLYPGYLILAFTFAGPLLGLSLGIREGAGVNELPKLYATGLATNLLALAAAFAVFLGMPMLLVALGIDRRWDRLKMKLPLFGPAYRAIHGARFFTSLAMGLGAGVEISRTVTLALRSTGSAELAAAAGPIVARIRRGSSLAESLESMPVLDPISLGAIAIGERTGTLDDTLERLADESADSAMRRCKVLAVAGVAVLTAAAFAVILKGLLAVILGPIADYFRQIGDI
ncbi:MAG: type II secretion system F family protein [Deltaproteobacteria bacterium]|nr:type II secretion system F family protein [Deltaproteobacteria bacterium]